MTAFAFDHAALHFRLIAHLAPAAATVRATDLNGAPFSSDEGDLARIEPSQINRHAHALAASAEATGWLHLLSRPGDEADVLIETAWGAGSAGYIEHHRTTGASYFELDEPDPVRAAALVRARVGERIAQLVAHGWQPVTVAPARPAGARPLSDQALMAGIAALAARRAADRRWRATASDAGDRVSAALQSWAWARAGEMAGLSGSTVTRKAAEHHLAASAPALLRAYHRRAAVWPLEQAMLAAVGTTTDERALSVPVGALVDRWWRGTVGFAALGWWRGHAAPAPVEVGPVVLDLGAPPSSPLVQVVTAWADKRARTLLDDETPLNDAAAPPAAHLDCPVRADDRVWRAWLDHDGDHRWRGHLALPSGHPWAEHVPDVVADLPVEAVIALNQSGTTWTLTLTPDSASAEAARAPSRLHQQLRLVAAHAALAAAARSYTLGRNP
jgi:hypothetical protein